MKINEVESWLQQQLQVIYTESESANIAALVLENITGLSRSERLLNKDEPLDVHQLHHLTQINQRLLNNEPVQYILGHSSFYGLKLFVDNNVLIPRPETEELVEWIISDVKASGKNVFEKSKDEADATTQLKIMDVGTGSGCIALALKKNMPKAEVWGCDVNEAALNVARRNGSELNIRVDFQCLDFLDAEQRRQLPMVDILVSNPPYVPKKDMQQMQRNVLDNEPHTALFVPDNDELIFYKALAEHSKETLYKNGIIYIEIHENSGEKVMEVFKQAGYQNVQIKKDMQGKDRMMKVTTGPLSPEGELRP
jgi:release factor glutamine methyltransferase